MNITDSAVETGVKPEADSVMQRECVSSLHGLVIAL